MEQVILITGASSGFGWLMADSLAAAGHVVYATMRDIAGKNSQRAAEIAAHAVARNVELRTLELDVLSDSSVAHAVETVIAEQGRIDVVVQNAGHMVWGPSEAFTPEQLGELYDINVLGTQRLNRAALPYMREARRGLIVWIGSSSVAGGVPPLLGPYFAAKAGMDALAVCYARELAPLGIETSIVVPGAFTQGTNHFAHAGSPRDTERNVAYTESLPESFADDVLSALARTVPENAHPYAVAQRVTDIVDMPFGTRPFRTVIDPADDGSVVSYAVIDRVREQFLHRIGFADLMQPKSRV